MMDGSAMYGRMFGSVYFCPECDHADVHHEMERLVAAWKLLIHAIAEVFQIPQIIEWINDGIVNVKKRLRARRGNRK